MRKWEEFYLLLSFVVIGVIVLGVGCCGLFSFLSAFLSLLSFAMCSRPACMKNWHWLLRNLGVFLQFSCVNKKRGSWLSSSIWGVQAENKVCCSSLPRSSLDHFRRCLFPSIFFCPPPRNILAPKTFLAQIEGNARWGRSLPSLWFKNFLLLKLFLDHS